MKKLWNSKLWFWRFKLDLKMKLSLILFAITIAVQANSTYSQGTPISLKFENVKIGRIIDEIEAKTEFKFIYKTNTIDINRNISINVKKEKIDKILSILFDQDKVSYEIYDVKILIKPAPKIESESNDSYSFTNQEQKKVAGLVTDVNGVPLMGVNVLEKGTSNGAVTNFDGEFSLNLENTNSILVFSFLGFETQELKVGDATVINVSLEEGQSGLEEVVVIGYGSTNRKDVTGSISTVDSDEINALPTTDVQQALKGRSAGVRVSQNSGQPGSGVQVQIRGGNSYLGNNNPLYVVDGFPLTGGIEFLNPANIESVNILKDASATAIYGSRGANGVVMITTKGGGKERKGVIDIQSYYGIQKVLKTYDLMNSQQFAELANISAENSGDPQPFDLSNLPNVQTDWQDEIFRLAGIQNHTLTFSGGGNGSSYSVSANYFEQDGIIKNTGQKRGSVRLSLNQKVNDWARITANAVSTRSEIKDADVNNGNAGNNIWSAALQAPPTVSVYDDEGNYSDVGIYPFSPTALSNPLLYTERKELFTSSKTLSNLALELDILEGLKFKVLGGVEQEYLERNFYSPSIIVNRTPQGLGSFQMTRDISYLNENILSYKTNVGDNDKLSAIGGFTIQTFQRKLNNSSASGFTTDILEDNSLGSAENTNPNTSNVSEWKLLSWLGRVNYDLNDKYLFTASIRADGSSRFGENNKWGIFSSGAFAWRLSNEEFLKNVDNLSDLKLRIGYGETGSTAIAAYQSLNTLGEERATFGNSDVIGFANVSAPNPDLKWETTQQLGIGIDASFFQDKYRVTVDYYKKNTEDLLAIIPLPGSTGFTSQITNLGEIENTGMEFSVGAFFGKNDFTWDVNAMVSFNKNKVVTIGQDILGGSLDIPFNSPINLAREGEPLGVFYGYIEDGYDDNGVIKYKDLNGDDQINSEDQQILGNPYPDFIYSLNNTLRFRNLSLNIFFEGSQGNELFWATGGYIATSFGTGGNQIVDVYNDYWTPTNTDAAYPAPSSNRAQIRVSDRFIKDASYLRLKNVKLGYTLSGEQIKWGVNSMELYISGQNLFTVTDFPGLDPDVNTRAGTGDLRLGIAQTAYPTARIFTLGVNLKI